MAGDIHPNDRLAALEWAVSQAMKASEDPLVALSILPALRAERDAAQREIRGAPPVSGWRSA